MFFSVVFRDVSLWEKGRGKGGGRGEEREGERENKENKER